MDKILQLPVEEQAKFCDPVTSSVVRSQQDASFLNDLKGSLANAPEMEDNWDLEKLTKSIRSHPKNFGDWNATSIGNLACLAVHSKNEEVKKTAAELLTKYNTYMAPVIAML